MGGQSQATPLLEAVTGCGVLVQGCWVLGSEVLYPGEGGRVQRNIRDYIVSGSSVCVGGTDVDHPCPTNSYGASHSAEWLSGRTLQPSPRSAQCQSLKQHLHCCTGSPFHSQGSHEDLRDVLRLVANQRAAQGWEFKLPTDHDFLAT